MSHKLNVPTVLMLSLLLGGCMKFPDDPPILATVKTAIATPAIS